MFKYITKSVALLAVIATIYGGITTQLGNINYDNSNAGIAVCNDLDTPSTKH